MFCSDCVIVERPIRCFSKLLKVLFEFCFICNFIDHIEVFTDMIQGPYVVEISRRVDALGSVLFQIPD